MKRCILRPCLLIFLLSIFSSFAFAGNETIIKGWIKQENMTIGGTLYNFVLSDDPKYVVLEFGGTLLKVYATFCDVEDFIQLCVDDVQHNRTDPITKERYYKAYITLTRQSAEATASQVADKDEGTIEDTFTITATIENTGSREAANVTFVQKFPASFSLEAKKSDCTLGSGIVSWEGKLAPNQRLSCPYEVRPGEAGKFSITGNLSYNNGVANKTVLLGVIELDIKNGSFEIQKSVSTNFLEVGDYVELNASVRNVLAGDNQSISFVIEVPKGFTIANKTYEFEKDGNTLSWDSQLSKGNAISAWVRLLAISSGNFSIPLKASYVVQGLEKVYVSYANVTVAAKPLEIIYNAPSHAAAGKPITITASLKSNTEKYYYDGIDASVGSGMPGFRAVQKTLDMKLQNYSSITVFNDTFTAPAVTENTTFNVTIHVKYMTEYDQLLSLTRRYELFVEAPYTPPEEKYFNIPVESLKDKANVSATVSDIANKVEDTLQVREIAAFARQTFSNPVNIILIVSTFIAVGVAWLMYRRAKKEGEPPRAA